MTIRLIVRGYKGRVLQFTQALAAEERDMDLLLPTLAEQHATDMALGNLTMIEIELVDLPDPKQRFIRIGTDPTLMVDPWEFNPGK